MSNQKVNNQDGHDAYEWSVYLFAFIMCIALWWGGMLFTQKYAVSEFTTANKSVITDKQLSDEEIKGLFGDSFGAVNALVSALAFAGVIVSLFFQRKDLKLQREELALTRQEMREQTMEFEKQNETLKIQRFENTFFNMLSQFQEVVNNLTATVNAGMQSSGREVFRDLYENATVYVKIPKDGLRYQTTKGMRIALAIFKMDGYMKSEMPAIFDHYFRLLYRILKFVRDTPLITKFDDEYEYTSMLRSILSRYELVWLYYNGLSEYGSEKLKPLIERYAMLKSLREDLLVKGVGVGSYADSAYRKTNP